MPSGPTISFSKNSVPSNGTLVILIPDKCGIPDLARDLDGDGQISRAIELENFSGKLLSTLVVNAPTCGLDRIILIGIEEVKARVETCWLKIGGKIQAMCGKYDRVTVITEMGEGFPELDEEVVARLAAGAKLRAYKFDDYKTAKKEAGSKSKKSTKITFGTSNLAATKRAWGHCEEVAEGVLLARQLVNLPPNVLGPAEFAKEAQKLKKLGVKVEVLGEAEMKKLGMHSLLGVAIGSEKPARLAIMKWDGGNKSEKPLAFIGKGVTFDTGGISLKPPAGMEDMKGDMGGAAAVTGLMRALAGRKAKVNVVGIIGLVENMPDGKAQRPGDIVKSMSGQTIEIINTDAEGRLVLADALWYCQDRFEPKFMIDLATLTGAILVALGKEYAGIFSNDDDLANNLHKAGVTTGEKVWRLPLDKAFDKMIDTKNADMKNTGGRYAGSITAAQFLHRFVNDVPWVHIDVAGTAMASASNEFNQSWGSGFGVRLLDTLVREYYE